MIERVCESCGLTYRTYPSIKPRFCSASCAGAAKRTSWLEPCQHCGLDFVKHPSRPDRRFCSKSCVRSAANLTPANPAFHRDITGANNPMYGKGLAGEANPMFGKRKEAAPRWTGGIKRRKDGYVLAVAPDDHPYPATLSASGTKYVLLHRLVMEEHLGRYLLPGEVVHHRDGNPRNNDIGNLELFASQAEHIKIRHG